VLASTAFGSGGVTATAGGPYEDRVGTFGRAGDPGECVVAVGLVIAASGPCVARPFEFSVGSVVGLRSW